MSQAESDSTKNPKRVTLSVPELHSLADRLLSRALSMLSTDTAEQQRDLKTASRVIRALLRNLNSSDTIVIENGA
jgi:hypothetical protein